MSLTAEPFAKLREPFPPDYIGKLPRVTCWNCSKATTKACAEHSKAKCRECGNYVSTAHMHLDYVGHADVTARLLDADPAWTWEPVAFDSDGLPKVDANGGLWIRLTVHGVDGPVTRLGYGDAQGKAGPNAVKEAIGDAIRNAAMRFGVALDLWAKGDRSAPAVEQVEQQRPAATPSTASPSELRSRIVKVTGLPPEKVEADFAEWSSGDSIRTASAEILSTYLGHVQKVMA